MLNGQILNLVSNLSLLSEEIWCLSVESYWILLPLGYYLCHFPFPWCTSLTSSQQKQQQFGCQGEHRLWNRGPTSMMNRPLMFVIWCHTVNAWMSPRELCSADLWTDSACVIKKPLLSSWQKKGKILPVCGECGGQANAPHLSCSRIKSFLSLTKQQQCQDNPCRQGSKAALPVESPYLSYCVFPLVFVFSQVLGLHCGCKGWQLIRVSPHSISWRTLCQLLCPTTSMHVQNPLHRIVCAWIF